MTKQNRKPQKTEESMKINLSNVIFDVVFHEQKQSNKARKNNKTTRKEKKTRKQGRKKQETRKREIEREREKEKEKWKKPRRKNGRHWEMNKDNPFSGVKKSVFVKRPKKQKIRRVEGQLPKNTRAGLRCTQSQEECAQKTKTPKQK